MKTATTPSRLFFVSYAFTFLRLKHTTSKYLVYHNARAKHGEQYFEPNREVLHIEQKGNKPDYPKK